jgi:transposase InsO family protein
MSLQIGERMLQSRRGDAAAAARAAGVSKRTLSRWKRRARLQEAPPLWGRRPHSEAARARTEVLVTREREKQGKRTGSRPFAVALGRAVPVRLIRRVLSDLKRDERREERRRAAMHRTSHDVLAKDAVWAQDATHLGSGELAEVARDRATTATRGLSLGPAAKAKDIVALLEEMRMRNGGLPLVWQTDNGSAYTSEEVKAYLVLHRVTHLRSRVHTPTDNAAMEHGIGEIKAELGSAAPTAENLSAAVRVLDHGRLRATRGWRTAAQLDAETARADALVERERFYEDVCSAIGKAVQGHTTARARRKAERAAIWSVLEQYGLARVRGPKPPEPDAGTNEIR